MRTRSVLLITLVALIGATPASAAPPVLGPADGVQAVRTDTTLVVTFTGDPAKWAPLVGRAVAATCRRTPNTTGLQLVDDPAEAATGVFAGQEKVAADGTLRYTLNTKDSKKLFDTCSLSGFEKRGDFVELAEAAVTPNGAAWLDESRRAKALHALLDRATGQSGYRPLAALGAGIVALDGSDATPAAEQTGYWTDGKHAAVATLSAAGRRLVIEDLGQGMVRTDVLEQSDPYASLWSAALAQAGAVEDLGDLDDSKKRSPYRGKQPLVGRDGVRVAVAGRRLRIRFTGRSAATFRKLAGRRVGAVCITRPAPSLFPPASNSRVRVATTRVPRAGDAIVLTLRGRPGDLCALVDAEARIALVATTPNGRRWLQDIQAMNLLTEDTPDKLAPGGASSYWPTATVVTHSKHDLVAMSGPDGRVAVGRVGVWTDGGQQAAVATTSASGWRPVIVDEGGGMQRTNVLGRFDLWGLLLTSGND